MRSTPQFAAGDLRPTCSGASSNRRITYGGSYVCEGEKHAPPSRATRTMPRALTTSPRLYVVAILVIA